MAEKITIKQELKNLTRAVYEVAEYQQVTIKRMEILDDISEKLEALTQVMQSNREKQGEVHKDLKADVKKIEFAVEDKVQEVKDMVDGANILVVKKGLLDKVKKIINKHGN